MEDTEKIENILAKSKEVQKLDKCLAKEKANLNPNKIMNLKN